MMDPNMFAAWMLGLVYQTVGFWVGGAILVTAHTLVTHGRARA